MSGRYHSPCHIYTYKSHKFELLEKSFCTYFDWGQNWTFTKLGNKQQTEAPTSHSHPNTPTPPSAGLTSMHILPVDSMYSSHMFSPSCFHLSSVFLCFLPPQPPFLLHLFNPTQLHPHHISRHHHGIQSSCNFNWFCSHVLSYLLTFLPRFCLFFITYSRNVPDFYLYSLV